MFDPAGFDLPLELRELRDAAERLGREVLLPDVRVHEAAGSWPEHVVETLRGFSLGGLDLPLSLGGDDAGSLAKVVLLEMLAQADAGGLLAADQPGVSAGAVVHCPDGDLAATVADECFDGAAAAVLVVGDAMWSWGPGWPTLRWIWHSDGGTLRLLEVTHAPEPAHSLGFHASAGVRVSLGDGDERGTWDVGEEVGRMIRARARLWLGAVAVGIAASSLDATIEYTTKRVVFGKPVAHHQGNAFELANLATQVHGARLSVRDAAAALDRGDADAAFWATQAWITATGAARAMTDAGIQLMGGHGFVMDHLAEKRFREARTLGLLAGGSDPALDDLGAVVADVANPFNNWGDHAAAG